MPWPENYEGKQERFQFRIPTKLKTDLEEFARGEGFDSPSAWLRKLAGDAIAKAKAKKKSKRTRG